MQYSSILSFGCLLAFASAQSSSSSSSSGPSSSSSATDTTVLSGQSDGSSATTPTGSYLSYASTIIVSSSAISTLPVISISAGSTTTRTTTIGSTTIFGYDTIIASNTTTSTGSTTTATQTYLVGSARSSTMSGNSTGNGTATSTTSSAVATNTQPCNNYPEFCSRSYGNITEVSAHNSPFNVVNNAASNQDLGVTTQLNDGIRFLQGQMHFNGSVPHFCHTSCDILDAGPITEYLGTVYNWVSTHPYDVVTIILENGDYKPVTDYVSFLESTGLVQYAYIPPKIPMGINDWPTLASMILTGKRVVFFMDYDANQTAVPWILDEFSQLWETPFDPTNRSFPCTTQRPPDLTYAEATSRMYMINHNLNYEVTLLGESILVPNIPLLNVTNANTTDYGTLGLSVEQCTGMWNNPPKALDVDYYNEGNFNGSVFAAAAKANNVTYNRACCGATSTSGSLGINEVVGRSAMLLAFCVVGASLLVL